MFFYMEKKTMKKRIISILAFLLMAVCLTGCATTQVSLERIEEFTTIAESIKNGPSYTLPVGFTFEQENNTQNGRIVIETVDESNKKYTQRAIFDMTQEEVKLEKIEVDYSGALFNAVWITFAIMMLLILILLY